MTIWARPAISILWLGDMGQQYLRKSSLVVGVPGQQSLDLSQLHFKFTVRRGDLQTPNTLDVRIYNVSDALAKGLLVGNNQTQAVTNSAEFSQISLSAGYENAQFGLLFQGSIIQVRLGRESQADTYVDIRAADGDSAYNFAVVNTSLAAGSTPAQHVNVNAAAMNLPQGFAAQLPATALPRGKVFFGLARDSMRQVAQANGVNWSIQNGQMQTVSLQQFVPGEVTVLNSASGMIGWPEITANGIHVRVLMNPNIKIGGVVQIDNKSVLEYLLPTGLDFNIAQAVVPRVDADGYYVTWIAEHTGDTRGQEWYTDLICLAVDQSILLQSGILNKFTVAPAPSVRVVNPYG